MRSTGCNPRTSATSWEGDIFAGVIRTKNWTAELTVSQEELVLAGPLGMRHALSASQVGKVRVAVGRFLFWSWHLKNTISISHNNAQVRSKLAFRSPRTLALVMLNRLRALGYTVS